MITEATIEAFKENNCKTICGINGCYLSSDEFTLEEKFHNLFGCPYWMRREIIGFQ